MVTEVIIKKNAEMGERGKVASTKNIQKGIPKDLDSLIYRRPEP